MEHRAIALDIVRLATGAFKGKRADGYETCLVARATWALDARSSTPRHHERDDAHLRGLYFDRATSGGSTLTVEEAVATSAAQYIDLDDAPRQDRLVVVRGMRWSDWVRHQEARGDSSAPRLAYLDGALEIMSPSRHHERLKSMIGRLVETWAFEKGIELLPLGSWTLEDRAQNAGAEPDECYQVGAEEKERPDLAIEVVWTTGGLSKLEIYRRLQVPEVWTWRRGQLHVHVLRGDAYEEQHASEVFPDLDLGLLLSLLDQPTVTAAQRSLLQHLRKPSAS